MVKVLGKVKCEHVFGRNRATNGGGKKSIIKSNGNVDMFVIFGRISLFGWNYLDIERTGKRASKSSKRTTNANAKATLTKEWNGERCIVKVIACVCNELSNYTIICRKCELTQATRKTWPAQMTVLKKKLSLCPPTLVRKPKKKGILIEISVDLIEIDEKKCKKKRNSKQKWSQTHALPFENQGNVNVECWRWKVNVEMNTIRSILYDHRSIRRPNRSV